MKDTKFMTAKEKHLVLKQWTTFVRNGFQQKHFTDRIYKHLTLHCSFIAHFDRNGFYSVYFQNNSNTIKFINQFVTGVSTEYSDRIWLEYDAYVDINNAMVEVMQQHADRLTTQIADAIQSEELAIAEKIAKKYGFTLNKSHQK